MRRVALVSFVQYLAYTQGSTTHIFNTLSTLYGGGNHQHRGLTKEKPYIATQTFPFQLQVQKQVPETTFSFGRDISTTQKLQICPNLARIGVWCPCPTQDSGAEAWSLHFALKFDRLQLQVIRFAIFQFQPLFCRNRTMAWHPHPSQFGLVYNIRYTFKILPLSFSHYLSFRSASLCNSEFIYASFFISQSTNHSNPSFS